jgi:hypothetical protein
MLHYLIAVQRVYVRKWREVAEGAASVSSPKLAVQNRSHLRQNRTFLPLNAPRVRGEEAQNIGVPLTVSAFSVPHFDWGDCWKQTAVLWEAS